jgi:hypothetical protein
MAKIYVDIDGTICRTNGTYEECVPMTDRIEYFNRLHMEGEQIIYYSARGNISGVDYSDFTAKQLASWGCMYYQLIMNHKPSYDLLICDKAINSEDFFTKVFS